MNAIRIRSACDRCHAMKMQCRTDGLGKHCDRCRNANVLCNYSECGKPGRPVAKSGNVTNQTSAALPTPSRSTSEEDAWSSGTFNEYGGAVEGSICLGMDYPDALKSKDGSLTAFSSSQYPYLHLDMAGAFGSPDWASEVAMSPIQMASEDQRVLRDPNPLIATPTVGTLLPTDRNWMEHLAYFQLKIARPMKSVVCLEPAQLEKEAAYVLQSSLEFLELVQMLETVAHQCKGSHNPSPISTVVSLQLSSMSMRLTEIHHWLYSSIYNSFQRRDADLTAHDNATGDGEECLLFSTAGVELIPSNFRLQMLLQPAVHYLNRIQESRICLGALVVDDTSQGQESPGLVLHMDKLINEDQKTCTSKIQAVLDNLKNRFTTSLNTSF